VDLQQHVVMKVNVMRRPSCWSLLPLLPALAGVSLSAQKFFPDDPIEKEPPPFAIDDANLRQLSPLLETARNAFKGRASVIEARGTVPAQGVNTLGEVLDSVWYENRHAKKRLSETELMRGPGSEDPPARSRPWRVLAVDRYGVRPGLLMADARNTVYLLRFDPVRNLELSTGAAMIGSRIFHALGYWVPEHYLVYLQRSELVAAPEGEEINSMGKAQKLDEEDIDLLLRKSARDPAKGYRAIALRIPPGYKLLGPYQFFDRRSDDPNDVVPHQHRRDLRGLHVISAWVGNNWISSLQTSDVLVHEGDRRFIRHYFIDFFNFLGAGVRQEKQTREGNEPFIDFHGAARNFLGFGLYSPEWQRARFPRIRSVGRFESEVFDPATWRPNFTIAAFANRTPHDDYWAARKVLAFTDDDIRAIVRTGQYSDLAAAEWIAKCLIERRDKIGRHFLEGVLPLDRFRVENGELRFDDVAALHGLRAARNYSVEWEEFRNFTGKRAGIVNANSFRLPERVQTAEPSSYYSAKITAENENKQKLVYVYFRVEKEGLKLVGIDRLWPGEILAEQAVPETKMPNRYAELQPRERELFDTFVASYNKKTGFQVEPQAFFDAQSISERTTFEGITNALSKTELTDQNGKSLGTALDLVTGIERVAGQYYGRSGDEQFRLYCYLRPDAREVLERSREFKFGEENTVFHVGYPHSYRQTGKEPTMQFSISDDGLKADIDVDYRSSKAPQAVWNGHLSSANSDVRSGDNYKRHSRRWSGLVNWWQGVFGNLSTEQPAHPDLLSSTKETATPLPPDRPAGAPIAEVQDAIQEFLTDWLVRRQYDEALQLVSDQALSCVSAEAGAAGSTQQNRQQLRDLLKQVSERLGTFEDLTGAVDAVIPWRKAFRVEKHAFEGDFTLVQAPDAYAKAFQCQDRSDAALTKAMDDPNPSYGKYYGAVFRMKAGANQGGAIGLLWTKENGAWRVVSWKVFGQ
jgi:hypothetical protein